MSAFGRCVLSGQGVSFGVGGDLNELKVDSATFCRKSPVKIALSRSGSVGAQYGSEAVNLNDPQLEQPYM